LCQEIAPEKDASVIWRASEGNIGWIVASLGSVPISREAIVERARSLSAAARTQLGMLAAAGGNKDGGLTTIYEKSLGAIAKAGGTAMTEVYQYAEPVTAPGFVVMDTPGLDPVSVTGIVAGGAQVMVFTTGRGSCFGCKPTPSIKVATNTPMYERMVDDMDLDAGTILAGKSVADVGAEIFDEIIAVASGKKTKSEQHGIGQEEFVPWNIGPTL
jgi:altronate hydrolase